MQDPSPYAAALLVTVLALLGWRTVKGQQASARFPDFGDTGARQAAYRRMALRSFTQFALGGGAILVLLGRTGALVRFPAEFAVLRGSWLSDGSLRDDWETLGSLSAGITAGALALYAVWRFGLRKRSQPVIGNVAHLFPRNRAEALATLIPAINAGVSEEIFFRLALPLLATIGTGSAWAGLGIATCAFGLVHWYQGWKGVILTGLVGLTLASVYLDTGSLIQPIAIHALVDVLALTIRPAIGLWLDSRKQARGPAA